MFSIDHIGVAVKSLAAAKGIYEELGLKLSPEEVVESEQVRVVMVPLGETRMELLEPTSENSVIAKFIAHGARDYITSRCACPTCQPLWSGSSRAVCAWFRTKSRSAQADISIFLCIPRARAECCWSWWKRSPDLARVARAPSPARFES